MALLGCKWQLSNNHPLPARTNRRPSSPFRRPRVGTAVLRDGIEKRFTGANSRTTSGVAELSSPSKILMPTSRRGVCQLDRMRRNDTRTVCGRSAKY